MNNEQPMSLSQASENLADADRQIDTARKNLQRHGHDQPLFRDAYNKAMAAYEKAYADYHSARQNEQGARSWRKVMAQGAMMKNHLTFPNL